VYGFSSTEPIPFRCATSTGTNAGGSGRAIYYTDDQTVELSEFVQANNQAVKLPNDFVINAHWLAIEGMQPALPENPQIVSKEMQKSQTIEGTAVSTIEN
jgi:transcription initiation factor TFIID subunit 6